MSFLDKVRACNTWNRADYVPFLYEGKRIGALRRNTVDELRRWPRQFRIEDEAVHWTLPELTFEERTEVLDEVVHRLIDHGVIPYRHGEMYPVTAGGRDEALALIDRASAPFFGVRAFGQHLNGFTRTGHGIEMWIGRRAADRRVYPNRLDNMVAGGLPHALGLAENLRKECHEEAGIVPALADRAVSVGAVTYCRNSSRGLKPDVMYCYDLEVPEDFVPHNTDGEVAAFYRKPVAEVLELVRDTDEFKLNCNLVIIDFLIRHGLITPDEPEYLALLHGLRSPLLQGRE